MFKITKKNDFFFKNNNNNNGKKESLKYRLKSELRSTYSKMIFTADVQRIFINCTHGLFDWLRFDLTFQQKRNNRIQYLYFAKVSFHRIYFIVDSKYISIENMFALFIYWIDVFYLRAHFLCFILLAVQCLLLLSIFTTIYGIFACRRDWFISWDSYECHNIVHHENYSFCKWKLLRLKSKVFARFWHSI